MKAFLIKLLLRIKPIYWIYLNIFQYQRRKRYEQYLYSFRCQDTYSAEELRLENENRLKAILQHARDTTEFYQEMEKEIDNTLDQVLNLKNIPILTKEIIKLTGDQLISSSFKKDKLIQRFTGGSTGQPMEFYADKNAMEIDAAQHQYLYELIGLKPKDVLVSVIANTLDIKKINKGIYWLKNTKGAMFGKYILSSKYFNESTIEVCAKRLIQWKPQLIRGYPSALNTLSEYILQDHKNRGPVSEIKGIVLTSEICTHQQKQNIEQAFRTTVFLEYGHKEISVFCHTRPGCNHYVSSAPYSYVEVLDESGKDTPIGEIGRIITTGFLNRGMPFIRYDTGDLGEVATRNGGIVTFSRIIGRAQDYILDKNQKKLFIIGTVYQQPLEVFKHISSWQLYQTKPGYVNVLIVKKPSYNQNCEDELITLLGIFTNIEFTLTYTESIPKTPLGKHLFVRREIDPEI